MNPDAKTRRQTRDNASKQR
uniref:Uncharacterized protein n=1 Tax=Anguilla anguilla TaxID=7936 RepID=A0A0E9P5C3_ANGAN